MLPTYRTIKNPLGAAYQLSLIYSWREQPQITIKKYELVQVRIAEGHFKKY